MENDLSFDLKTVKKQAEKDKSKEHNQSKNEGDEKEESDKVETKQSKYLKHWQKATSYGRTD